MTKRTPSRERCRLRRQMKYREQCHIRKMRLDEIEAREKSKCSVEDIVDEIFGLKPEPRKILTLKHNQNDTDNALAGLIVALKGNDKPENTGSRCLHNTWLYSVR
ncbi:hypothetical protein OO184_10890 [Photorhabdus sp. APURE]|uniref:hypothetical protein n=1 Tax=Photorhabdus aballayi TaxID=2991723 RepID=UPI00223DB3FE|nr:hypothetical protein [Photorhabdus aballayi]MCW7548434.1 hypothetical protein [Photorhabdus aballayi]